MIFVIVQKTKLMPTMSIIIGHKPPVLVCKKLLKKSVDVETVERSTKVKVVIVLLEQAVENCDQLQGHSKPPDVAFVALGSAP